MESQKGTFLFDPATGNVLPDPAPDPALTDPVAQYSHEDGIAVLGGYIYRADTVPALTRQVRLWGFFYSLHDPKWAAVLHGRFELRRIRELRLGNDERPLGLFMRIRPRCERRIYALASSNLGPSGASGEVLKIVSAPASAALVNLATRLRVQTGDNVLIGGFILTGSAPKKVILRAIGPR